MSNTQTKTKTKFFKDSISYIIEEQTLMFYVGSSDDRSWSFFLKRGPPWPRRGGLFLFLQFNNFRYIYKQFWQILQFLTKLALLPYLSLTIRCPWENYQIELRNSEWQNFCKLQLWFWSNFLRLPGWWREGRAVCSKLHFSIPAAVCWTQIVLTMQILICYYRLAGLW